MGEKQNVRKEEKVFVFLWGVFPRFFSQRRLFRLFLAIGVFVRFLCFGHKMLISDRLFPGFVHFFLFPRGYFGCGAITWCGKQTSFFVFLVMPVVACG